MDNSYIPTDSDDSGDDLPDLSVLLNRSMCDKFHKTQGKRLELTAHLAKPPSLLFSSGEIPKPQKQRALKKLEPNGFLMLPLKSPGQRQRKPKCPQSLHPYSPAMSSGGQEKVSFTSDGNISSSMGAIFQARVFEETRENKPLESFASTSVDRHIFKEPESSSTEQLVARFELPSSTIKPAMYEKDDRPSSSYDDHPALLTYEPRSIFPRKAVCRPCTPTKSLSTAGRVLVLPSKTITVPSASFLPSTDDFWSQSAVDSWNDQHPPGKSLTSPRKIRHRPVVLSDSDESIPSTPTKTSLKTKNPSKIESAQMKRVFESRKEQLALDFLKELDDTITEGRISALAKETGGVRIIWSKKLNSTAGMAHWKRESVKGVSEDGTTFKAYRHQASIELATKVIDDESRLINTLAHEFCHLANFMVSEVRNNPHGKEFKEWATKCNIAFRHRDINVTTKHSYAIDYKYIWECTGCRAEFKRHSKSIKPKNQSCGSCRSKLLQTKPERRKGAESEYQAFIKENFQRLKRQHDGKSFGDIMSILGKLYREQKLSKDDALDVLVADLTVVGLASKE